MSRRQSIILSSNHIILNDGTFKTIPSIFSNYIYIYTIHGATVEQDHLLVHCLCLKKIRKHVCNDLNNDNTPLLTHSNIHVNLRLYVIKFDVAAMNSMRLIILNVTIKVCLFHFTKAIFKKVVNEDLKKQLEQI